MWTPRAWTAPLAAALLLTVASPASASSGITSPGAGTVVRADAVVALRAVVEEPGGPNELSLQAPGAPDAEVVAVSAEPGELAYDLDTACGQPVCDERRPVRNGTWTVRLSGAAEDQRTFVLRIPPAAPEQVEATRSEMGVMVRWLQGDEPDLRGYRVQDADGRLVKDRVGLQACDAERRCSVEVPEDAGAWTVRAYRATCPGCRELLLSPTSQPARVAADPIPGPGASAGPAPSATAAAPAPAVQQARRADQRRAFLGVFGSTRPAVAPPPAAARLPVLPQDDGSYEQELGYGEREIVVPEPRGPVSRAQEAPSATLWTGECIGLVVLSLLLVAGSVWLRRWTRRAIAE